MTWQVEKCKVKSLRLEFKDMASGKMQSKVLETRVQGHEQVEKCKSKVLETRVQGHGKWKNVR